MRRIFWVGILMGLSLTGYCWMGVDKRQATIEWVENNYKWERNLFGVSPTPDLVFRYQAPEIVPQDVYEVALMGDSMTAALGPHGGMMTEKLNEMFENRDILVDNYAVAATNLMTLDERLRQVTQVNEWRFKPILERPELDLIIFESYAYNPLSHIKNREEALAKQEEILDRVMWEIKAHLPNTRVVFAVTIAPSSDHYAEVVAGLSDEESRIQAEERVAYLKNHIKFAQERGIPVINIYEQSLTPEGDGDLVYINPDDWIHPSAKGVELIATVMAEFVAMKELLPK